MKTLTKNGVSTTQKNGEENYTTFQLKRGGRFKKFYQYDYRHTDGELFSTCASSLSECRSKRDNWIERRLNHG